MKNFNIHYLRRKKLISSLQMIDYITYIAYARVRIFNKQRCYSEDDFIPDKGLGAVFAVVLDRLPLRQRRAHHPALRGDPGIKD